MTTAAELAALIRDDIAAALAEPDQSLRMTALRAAAEEIFRIAYDEVPGDPKGVDQATIDFLNQINGAMGQTHPDGTDEQVERIAGIWGVAAANGAQYYSAPKANKTWITMLDDRVRDLHVPMHGTTVAAGQTFSVGGHSLHYPGEPVGPPEVWINCRCTLDMSLTADGGEMAPIAYNTTSDAAIKDGPADSGGFDDGPWYGPPPNSHTHQIDSLVARSYDTAQRKAMSKRGTAMPDGSFPIADLEDLRNAIQAIGRAKDPDAAKRHIRKRARALGHADLIPESWSASGDTETADATEDSLMAWPPSTSPPGTHDAPGWITHPRETARIRRYWVRGPGAAKIGWGTPNDLTRCAGFMRKYMTNPRHVWGTCQNMHKEALGYWNPESRPSHRSDGIEEDFEMITAAFTAAAEIGDNEPHLLPPGEWFADPGLTAATALQVGRDGRVVGHLATWDTCHVGIDGECRTPPRSQTAYAYFRLGEVETREGERIPVGQITMDTGHAGKHDGPLAAVAHYDNTGTAVADVAAGEDDHGIWVAGAMRPGVSEQQMYVLQATGKLSGDWRRIGGNLELVAALAVNVPGYPIPRMELAASGEYQLSLVAAGIVGIDPNAADPDRVAVAVLTALDAREADKARRARADALMAQVATLRVEALTAAIS